MCSLATYYNRYSITIDTCYKIGITLGVIKLFGNQTPKFGASGAADFFLALLKLLNFAYGSQQMSYWEHFLLKWFRSPKLWTGAWWSHILICDQRLSPGGQSSWITDYRDILTIQDTTYWYCNHNFPGCSHTKIHLFMYSQFWHQRKKKVSCIYQTRKMAKVRQQIECSRCSGA